MPAGFVFSLRLSQLGKPLDFLAVRLYSCCERTILSAMLRKLENASTLVV